ncbi:MAG: hypothetical protein J3K34DRAFT_415601 [Monoraphidium minutum]|nr:MAG: hypothetical protein J3K34DRAFT_415601 [Monoraphidium minutum]
MPPLRVASSSATAHDQARHTRCEAPKLPSRSVRAAAARNRAAWGAPTIAEPHARAAAATMLQAAAPSPLLPAAPAVKEAAAEAHATAMRGPWWKRSAAKLVTTAAVSAGAMPSADATPAAAGGVSCPPWPAPPSPPPPLAAAAAPCRCSRAVASSPSARSSQAHGQRSSASAAAVAASWCEVMRGMLSSLGLASTRDRWPMSQGLR